MIVCVDVWICKVLGSLMDSSIIFMPWYIYSSLCILCVIFQLSFPFLPLPRRFFSFGLLKQSLTMHPWLAWNSLISSLKHPPFSCLWDCKCVLICLVLGWVSLLGEKCACRCRHMWGPGPTWGAASQGLSSLCCKTRACSLGWVTGRLYRPPPCWN